MQYVIPSRQMLRQFVYWTLLIFLAGFYFFPKSKPHNTAYYALVLLPFLVTLQRKEVSVFWRSSIFRLTIVFLTYLTFTTAWGDQTTTDDWIKYLKRLIYMLGFACMIMTYYNARYLNRLCLIISSTAVVMAAISMFLYDSSLYSGPDRLKNFGILEHEILAASTYGFAAMMLIYGCQLKLSNIIWIKLFGMTVLILDILWTQSRGPLLAIISSICIAELLRDRHRKLIIFLVMTTILTMLLMIYDVIQTPQFISRNGGDSYRFEIWSQIWQRVLESPFYGLGLSTNETILLPACGCIPHPHNIYLATMFYGGLAGLVLLLAILINCFKSAYTQYQSDGQVKFLAFLMFGIICGFSDGNKLLDHPRPMWLFFWLPILLIAARQLYSQRQSDKSQLTEQ